MDDYIWIKSSNHRVLVHILHGQCLIECVYFFFSSVFVYDTNPAMECIQWKWKKKGV